MQHGAVADGAITADIDLCGQAGGDAGRAVDHGLVLDIGESSDGDLVSVSADNSAIPNLQLQGTRCGELPIAIGGGDELVDVPRRFRI